MDIENFLNLGTDKKIISEEQKNSLIDLYKSQQTLEPKQVSDVVKVIYYVGGFIMLCAMICLMSDTVQNSTYMIILSLGTLYAFLFLGIGEFLWRKNEKFPAEILYFLFITSIAFIIMDIEKMTGFFPHFSDMDKYSNYWDMCIFPVITLSTLTIIVNSIIQKFRQAPLLAIPTIICSYAIYMSFVDLIYGWTNITTKITSASTLLFSTGLTIIAFIKDRLTKVDYSKWSYLFGTLGIFISVNVLLSEFNLVMAQIQLINLIFGLIYILIGILLKRKPFSIIGILSVIEYIMYIEFSNIDNTTLLTSAVLITGLALLYTGVLYNKNVNRIENFIENKLPHSIRKLLPHNRV